MLYILTNPVNISLEKMIRAGVLGIQLLPRNYIVRLHQLIQLQTPGEMSQV